jgi:hypothetical protein
LFRRLPLLRHRHRNVGIVAPVAVLIKAEDVPTPTDPIVVVTARIAVTVRTTRATVAVPRQDTAETPVRNLIVHQPHDQPQNGRSWLEAVLF